MSQEFFIAIGYSKKVIISIGYLKKKLVIYLYVQRILQKKLLIYLYKVPQDHESFLVRLCYINWSKLPISSWLQISEGGTISLKSNITRLNLILVKLSFLTNITRELRDKCILQIYKFFKIRFFFYYAKENVHQIRKRESIETFHHCRQI